MSVSNEIILEAKGIVKDFPGQRALDHVDLDIRKGEVHALVGENGAGKSTLIKIIAGVYHADEGEILIDGEPQSIQNTRDSQGLGLSFIHQDLNIVPHLSAAENMLLGLKYPKNKLGMISYRKLTKMVEDIPDSLDIGASLKTPVNELSVVQQWKIAINRALALNCRIMFMDEPTASLSYEEVTELFRAIAHLKRTGKSVVYISHRMEEIFEIADRVTVIKDSKKVGTESVKEMNIGKIFQKMVGKELGELFPAKDKPTDEVRLEVKNLKRADVVKNVSFRLRAGEVLGIAGLVGSGRSEIVRLIFGADKKDNGEIYIDGQKVEIKSTKDAVREGIALVPEERRTQGAVLSMDVKENITLANLRSMRLWSKAFLMSKRKEKDIANNYVKSINIRISKLAQSVDNLSGGNQQKVVLSKWLCSGAKIFIFDEPTNGIDVGAKLEFYKLIANLGKEGIGVIVISSDLTEVLGLCHRIIVVSKGEIKTELLAEQTDFSSLIRLCLEDNEQEQSENQPAQIN